MSRSIRLLIAEDHEVVREGLVMVLSRESDIEVIAQASNGREAIELYRCHRPDVALIDLRLPLLDGADVIALLRPEFPESRFLVLTTFGSDVDVARALRAGARGYLLKGVSASTVAEAIRSVFAGGRVIHQSLLDRTLAAGAEITLTRRERQVLNCVAEGRSNREIAERLAIEERTVKGHIHSLLAKLSVTDRTQALIEAAKRGLIRLGD